MNNRNMITAGVALAVLSAGASAWAAGNMANNEVRVGAYIVMYDAKADDLTGPYVPPGVNVDVKNVTTPYFAYLRRLSPHFVAQLAAGVPPKTETVGKGPATLGSVPFNGQVVSTAKWFSPSILVNYVFRDEDAALRPYLGAGVNYTRFYDLKSTAAGDAANGGPTAIKLSSSTGPVFTAGLRWHIKDNWSAYASYDVAKVNSDYVGDTAGVIRKTHIKFNPSTLVLSVGYAF
ncbi:MAG: OmpW family protein [Proteobacteria bacterium]|nr:OmpW family protein [Pseudomonadota bacterium]